MVNTSTKRQMVQIPSEQVKLLLEVERIRPDLAGYPVSRKVHVLLQEKLSDILKTSFTPFRQRQKWVEYVRESIPLHTVAPLMLGMIRKSQDMIGKPFTKVLVSSDSEKLWWCNYSDDIDSVGKFLLDKLKDKKESVDYYRKYETQFKGMQKACQELRNKDLTALTKNELKGIYSIFYTKLETFYGLTYDIDAIDIVLEQSMRDAFAGMVASGKTKIKDGNAAYALLTTPTELSSINVEQLEIYRIAHEIQHTKKILQLFDYDIDVLRKKIIQHKGICAAIEKLVKEFWWTSLGWTEKKEKTFDTYLLDIKRILRENPDIEHELERLSSFVGKTREAKKQLAETLGFDEKMNIYLDVFNHYILYHDYRKEIQMKSTSVLNTFLYEVSRRCNCRYDDLVWCWPSEIEECILHGSIDADIVMKRKQACFVIITEHGIEQESGEKAIRRREQELAADVGNVQDFKGIIASLGKATGKVKVCFSAADAMQKIEKGDILVASMTMPDYLPAMKKAGAIITDEGGVTCHAAIIARELKLPCIVGTKIATKVLKDGDLVEVNANHGAVKIAERKL